MPRPSATDLAVSRIWKERHRQEQLKAEGRFEFTLADDGLTMSEKLGSLVEELGEVAIEIGILEGRRQVRNAGGSVEALATELTQLGAVVVAFLESLIDITETEDG